MTRSMHERLGLPGNPPEWLPPGRPGPGSRPDERPAEHVGSAAPAPWLEQRMFEQQTVAVTGPLTAESASRAGSALMTLEALATPRGGPIQLHLSGTEGDLSAAFALIDVLDGMRSPVRAVALGRVGGAVLGVYAVTPERVAYPHARFLLAEPRTDRLAGTAEEVTLAAGSALRLLDDLVVRLAEATGQPRARIERDMSEPQELSVREAIDYGLVHRIGPGAR